MGDEDGVVHYGDHIPAEYTNDPHERFNQSGVKIGTDEGELSKEEVAARAEQERIKQQGLAYDEQLLKAYEQVSDIERLREARLADLKQQDELAKNYLQGLEKRQKDLEIEAQRYNYPYDPLSEKPPVPDNLTRELMDTAANVEKYRDMLAKRVRMREELVASFNRDIERFQELKSKH
jgi:vacuolar-type H+-ATPase subunit I/STV1